MTDVAAILARSHTIAMVGLSSKPERASFQVAAYLQAHGYRVIPVNPRETSVLGKMAVATLHDIHEPIDIVNVFRESAAVPEIVDEVIAVTAPVLWLQLDIHHPDAELRASQHGITVITDVCIKIAHQHINYP
ncbi:MAG: CoA-binding protein [Roseiflexaceae bacterium]